METVHLLYHCALARPIELPVRDTCPLYIALFHSVSLAVTSISIYRFLILSWSFISELLVCYRCSLESRLVGCQGGESHEDA